MFFPFKKLKIPVPQLFGIHPAEKSSYIYIILGLGTTSLKTTNFQDDMTDTNDPVEVLIVHSFHGLQRGPDITYCNVLLIRPVHRGIPFEGFMQGFIPTEKGGVREVFRRTLTEHDTPIEYIPATADKLTGELRVGEGRYKVLAEHSGSTGIVFERRTFPLYSSDGLRNFHPEGDGEVVEYLLQVARYIPF